MDVGATRAFRDGDARFFVIAKQETEVKRAERTANRWKTSLPVSTPPPPVSSPC